MRPERPLDPPMLTEHRKFGEFNHSSEQPNLFLKVLGYILFQGRVAFDSNGDRNSEVVVSQMRSKYFS